MTRINHIKRLGIAYNCMCWITGKHPFGIFCLSVLERAAISILRSYLVDCADRQAEKIYMRLIAAFSVTKNAH